MPCSAIEVGSRFTVRLHIFCLFLEVSQYHDLRTPVILSIKEFKLMPKLISLLNETEDVLTSKAGKCLYTPKWLSQMILLIDLYEKVVVSIRRRNEMHRITTNSEFTLDLFLLNPFICLCIFVLFFVVVKFNFYFPFSNIFANFPQISFERNHQF